MILTKISVLYSSLWIHLKKEPKHFLLTNEKGELDKVVIYKENENVFVDIAIESIMKMENKVFFYFFNFFLLFNYYYYVYYFFR